MYALAEPAPARIDVCVWAADPLSRAGTIAQLRGTPGFEWLTRGRPRKPQSRWSSPMTWTRKRSVRSARCAALGGGGVALLVTRLDDRGLLSAVEAGVGGVLRRSQATVGNVVSTIRSVAAGEGTLPPDMLARLLEQVGQLQRQVLAPRGLTFSGLTERELEVLRLLADGYDTAEVSGKLYYSERTVKNIIHDITSRLELRNRTHAVAYAIKPG